MIRRMPAVSAESAHQNTGENTPSPSHTHVLTSPAWPVPRALMHLVNPKAEAQGEVNRVLFHCNCFDADEWDLWGGVCPNEDIQEEKGGTMPSSFHPNKKIMLGITLAVPHSELLIAPLSCDNEARGVMRARHSERTRVGTANAQLG